MHIFVKEGRGFIRKSRLDHLPNLAEVISMVADFLRPLATALAAGHACSGKWIAPGPWTGLGNETRLCP